MAAKDGVGCCFQTLQGRQSWQYRAVLLVSCLPSPYEPTYSIQSKHTRPRCVRQLLNSVAVKMRFIAFQPLPHSITHPYPSISLMMPDVTASACFTLSLVLTLKCYSKLYIHTGMDYLVNIQSPSRTFTVVFQSKQANSSEHVILLLPDDEIYENHEYFRLRIVAVRFSGQAAILFRAQDGLTNTFADVNIQDDNSKFKNSVCTTCLYNRYVEDFFFQNTNAIPSYVVDMVHKYRIGNIHQPY